MHHSIYLWLVIVTWIVLLATLFFNYLGIGNIPGVEIFPNSQSEVSNEFDLDATPAGGTFLIWIFIYSYQVIWLIYGTVDLCRRGLDGTPLYACAPFLHWSIFVVYIINLLANVGWNFAFNNKLLTVALVPIALTALTMYYTTAMSIYGIYRYYPLLAENGFRKENRYVLGLVSNAFAMYGTWVTAATLFNFGTVLAYSIGMPQQAVSTIVLAILTVEVMIWVIVDLAFLERFTRFLFTPYVVLIVALTGIIVKNFNGYDPNDIFSVMLLIVVIVMLCVKISLVVYREMNAPAFKKVEDPAKTIIYY